MSREQVLVTVPPRSLPALRGWEVTPAHLAWQLGRGPHLYRAADASALKGGVLVAGDRRYDGLEGTGTLAREFVRECQNRNFTGAILDFDRRLPALGHLARQLEELFRPRGWTLFVPEAYGPALREAMVMIPSALSGGSLEQRLQEAVERYGAGRVTLALQKSAEDFLLPAPTGSGSPLSPAELAALQKRLHPSVFFSDPLCARYFTYMEPGGATHFVLFDDGDTLRRKMETARKAGITSFIASWAEVEPHGRQLGLAPGTWEGRRMAGG